MKKILKLLLAGLIFTFAVPGLAILLLDDERPAEENIINQTSIPAKIVVWDESRGRTFKVDFEDYVVGVVASEMPCDFEMEALKAQSVAARTFAVARLEKFKTNPSAAHPKAAVCNTTHCQVYKSEKELVSCHEEGWEDGENGLKKIKEACKSTEGELLYYDGELVMQPLFFSSSGGQTENAEDVFTSSVPYLVSVSSPYEDRASHQNEAKSFTLKELKEILSKKYPEKVFGDVSKEKIKILSRTAGGRVDEMQIGDVKLKGTEVRLGLGLSSALFSVEVKDEKVIFTSSGYGHGVGLSQYGADGMAENGADYKEILEHYYSGTEVK